VTVAVHTIRQSCASTLEVLAGWRESRWPYDLLGMDPNGLVHKSFAIGVGQSIPVNLDRQVPATGVYVETEILVRFLWRLRPDNMRGDYDAALAGESALVVALVADPPSNRITFKRVVGRAVEAVSEGRNYFVGTIQMGVHHHYALN
jgi:hypothetical protein